MITGNQIRVGMVIEHNSKPHYVMEAVHRTPGNKRAFMQTKLRNLLTGDQAEARFSSTDRVERLSLVERKMQFLYQDGDDFCFMDTGNYEQTQLNANLVGDAVNLLMPEMVLGITFYEDKPIGIKLPKTLDLTVVETEPELKGATAVASYKPAKLETGLQIKVPPFIREGDKVRVDTSTHDYVTRVT